MTEIVITDASRDATRSARIGDTLVIQLPEIPTTGFRWAPTGMDTNILEPKGDEFQLGAQSGIGGGGLRVFRFLAKNAGHVSLQFKLTRAWEPDPPKAVFKVRVEVNEN